MTGQDVNNSESKPQKRNRHDPLNMQIIRLLQEDGRMSYSAIAEKLGLSEGAIRKRVARLQSDDAIKIVAVENPLSLSYDTYSMLGIQVAPGHHPETVAERLSEAKGVVYAIWVSGAYDILIEVVFETKSGFVGFLSDFIYNHDEIANCDVMQNLSVIKNNYYLKPLG